MATFPLLKAGELVKFFRDEKSLEMTVDQFTNPALGPWYNIYLILAAKILNILPEELEEKLRLRPLTTEHFFLYEGAVTNIKLATLLKPILTEIGVRDFSLLDIRKPNKKRLCFALSGILNFLRFQDSLVYMYDEVVAKEKSERSENTSLLTLKNEMEKEREELKQEGEKIKKSIDDFSHKFSEDDTSLKTDLDCIQDLKKKKKDADSKLEELSATAARKKEQLEELRARLKSAQKTIVHSPMRHKQEAQLNKEKLLRLVETCKHYLAKCVEKKKQLEKLKKAKEEGANLVTDYKNLMSSAADIKEKVKLLMMTRNEMEDISTRLSSEKQTISELLECLKRMIEESEILEDSERREMLSKQEELISHVNGDEKNKGLISKAMPKISVLKQLKEKISSDTVWMDNAATKKMESLMKSADEFNENIVEKYMNKTYEDFQKMASGQ